MKIDICWCLSGAHTRIEENIFFFLDKSSRLGKSIDFLDELYWHWMIETKKKHIFTSLFSSFSTIDKLKIFHDSNERNFLLYIPSHVCDLYHSVEFAVAPEKASLVRRKCTEATRKKKFSDRCDRKSIGKRAFNFVQRVLSNGTICQFTVTV